MTPSLREITESEEFIKFVRGLNMEQNLTGSKLTENE